MPILENFYVILGVLFVLMIVVQARGLSGMNKIVMILALALFLLWLDNPVWFKKLLRGIMF